MMDVLEPGKKCGDDDCVREMILVEQASPRNGNEDVDVNITEYKNSGKSLMVQDFFEDLTESSSSCPLVTFP
jgi:hypothetical protein